MKKIGIDRGFSLVELTVVLGVIALILALSFAFLSGARIKSLDSAIKAHIREIRLALEDFATEYGGYPNDGDGSADLHCLSESCEVVVGGGPAEPISNTLPNFVFPALKLNLPFLPGEGNTYKGIFYRDCDSLDGVCSVSDPNVGVIGGTTEGGVKFYPASTWEPQDQIGLGDPTASSCVDTGNHPNQPGSGYSCSFNVLAGECDDDHYGLCVVNGPNSCGWRTCEELDEVSCGNAAVAGYCNWQ